ASPAGARPAPPRPGVRPPPPPPPPPPPRAGPPGKKATPPPPATPPPHPHAPPAPPARGMIRSPGGRIKDALQAPATPAGLPPGPCPARPLAEDGSYPGREQIQARPNQGNSRRISHSRTTCIVGRYR